MGTHLLGRARSPAMAFWAYWSATAVSGVGTAVSAVALPLTAVMVLHASAFQVGLLTAASYVAWLVIGLPAGVLVARTGLRGLQVAMDLVRACALAAIPLAWWLGSLSFAQLAATALVDSFATVLFETGNMTLLPAIVPREQLSARNSLVSGTLAATQLGGPSLGGLLVQLLGAPLAVLGDAVSYLVSAVFMSRLPARVAQPASHTTMTAMIRDGWRFVARHPVIRPCMWAAALVNFICGALLALTPLYLIRVLHTPPGLVGVLIATEGAGALLGAALTPRLSRAAGTARAILLASGFGALSALVMPAGNGVAGMLLFGTGNAGFATGVVVLSVNTRTYRQTESPPELLSQVMATVRVVSWGAVPLGSLLAGAAATALGIRPALWLTCAATLLPLALLLSGPVAKRRDLNEHGPAERRQQPAGEVL